MNTDNLIIGEKYYVVDNDNLIFIAKLLNIAINTLSFNEYIDNKGITRLHISVIPTDTIKFIEPVYQMNIINFKSYLSLDLVNVKRLLSTLKINGRYYIYYKENIYKNTKLIIANYTFYDNNNIHLINCVSEKNNIGSSCIEINKICKILSLYDIVKNKKNGICNEIWNYINMYI
jgi:hypothetical protein